MWIRPMAVMVAASLGFIATASDPEEAPGSGLRRLSERFQSLVVVDAGETGGRIAYADARGHVHVYRYERGGPAFEWETTALGSRVAGLIVTDVEGDGKTEIVVATMGGRILLFDARSYEPVWDNGQDPFDDIRCMIVDDIDEDPQRELIVATTSHLVCLDGITKLVEWKVGGYDGVGAMVLGNTDEDEQRELVLNTGVVFDTRHLRPEFEGAEPFGTRIDLLDLTGDGIPEVIGEGPDSALRVFDVYRQRELW